MSIFRNITWYMRGLKEYTKGGYELASKSFNANDLDVNLNDKSIMITGANSGVGKSCALELAKLGATIYMVCRNKERGENAMTELKESSKSDKFSLHLVDMADPKQVKTFAKEFSETGKPLDILINNAGCMVNTLTKNSEGLEINFVTNTLSTYILTEGLIDLLKKSSDPRVVVVSSGGMLVQKLDTSDLNFEKRTEKHFDGTMVYAQNKRQQVVMVEHWAKKYSTVKFSSMHPGWSDTPAVASSMPSFYDKHQSKLRTPQQGSDTMVWLAASKAALDAPNGEFFQDRKVTAKHLPLAWTKTSEKDTENLISILDKYSDLY